MNFQAGFRLFTELYSLHPPDTEPIVPAPPEQRDMGIRRLSRTAAKAKENDASLQRARIILH